jgi:hypothetical protein
MALLVVMALPQLAAGQSEKIDPQAVRLLKAATDFVASQKAFAADTRNTLEIVLTTGQKIQFDHAAKLSVQRPNKLRAERTGDLVEQVFYYDGKSLTLANPSEKYFATVAAPPTLEEMLDFARSRLDIIAPAGDLLYRNSYDILMTNVSSGFVVGKGIVEGVRCDHLAFRAPHVDWQIWIEEGARPLPRKLVITTRDVVNAPQFSVVVTRWDLQPKQADGMFSFTPAKDAKKVDFLPPAGAPSGR